MLRQIETLSGYGLSMDKIAAVLGIGLQTLTRRKRDNELVNGAVMRGRAMMEATCARSLFDRVKEGEVPAIKWYETTRCGRAEKQDVKQETEVTIKVMPHAD